MKCKIWTLISAMAFFAALAVPVRLAAQGQQQTPPNYVITDLGTLGGDFSWPGEINNHGEVDGYSYTPNDAGVHAFLWHNGVMTDLGSLDGPGGSSAAEWRPSESGLVGGFSTTGAADPNGEDWCGFGAPLTCLPFMWQDGKIKALPTLGGNNGQADGANSQGQLVGYTELKTYDPSCPAGSPAFQTGGVEWRNGRIQQVFHPLSGDPDANALALNDLGQVVGVSANCGYATYRAVLWQDGKVNALGTLGGTLSQALDINNQGQVTGNANISGDAAAHAFIWQRGRMTDLGTLPGDVRSKGEAINNNGQVAGYSADQYGNTRPVLWQNGGIWDLNTLIPADTASSMFLGQAFGINDRGQVTGWTYIYSTGEVHAFLATPTTQHWPPHGRSNFVLPDDVRNKIGQHRRHDVAHEQE